LNSHFTEFFNQLGLSNRVNIIIFHYYLLPQIQWEGTPTGSILNAPIEGGFYTRFYS
jgi:hypothetical protein